MGRQFWFKKKQTVDIDGVKIEVAKRSGLEEEIAAQIEKAGVEYAYEKAKYKYHTAHTYTPDFQLPNGIIIEVKGRFLSSMRTKHLQIKKENPDLDIRFVFSRSKSKLDKGSKTTYASWCEKHGFQYADERIPQEWLDEAKK